ncbi:hypothetical protein SGPA1_50553 [Streptomyces misionensis JCM 4497]
MRVPGARRRGTSHAPGSAGFRGPLSRHVRARPAHRRQREPAALADRLLPRHAPHRPLDPHRRRTRPERAHPVGRLHPHQFRHVLREPAQQHHAPLRRLARRPLRGAQHLPHALRRPVELERLQPPLHRLRRRHVPHPAGRHPEVPVDTGARGRQQQRQAPPAGRAGREPGQVQQRQGHPGHRARRRPGPQHPRPAPLPQPVPQVPVRRAQRAVLHPPVQLVQPLAGFAPVAGRQGPAGQIARPGTGRALAPPVLRRPLGLHLRLTHPALPTDHDRSRGVTFPGDVRHPSYRPTGGPVGTFPAFPPGRGP